MARAAIRDFVREVAPALQLTESSQERSSPSGEGLLDTSRRPRSIRASMNQGARVSSDVGDVVKSGIEMQQRMTLAPPIQSHISGTETCFPLFQSGSTPSSSPTGIAPQEMVGTIALALAVG